MVQTYKTVGLFEATKSAGDAYNTDVNNLYDFLIEPFNVPHIIYTQVTIPTVLKFQFFAFHVGKALSFMVQEEMMSQESAKALQTAIDESGAYEIEIESIYHFKTKVKGCNE